MTRIHQLAVALAAATLLSAASPASAQDKLKLTIGQRGNWDTAIAHLGTKAGIFKKNGIELDMVYTSGSGETLQPIIGGAVGVGLAVEQRRETAQDADRVADEADFGRVAQPDARRVDVDLHAARLADLRVELDIGKRAADDQQSVAAFQRVL